MKDDLTSLRTDMATLLGEVSSIRKQLVMQRAMTRLVFDLDDPGRHVKSQGRQWNALFRRQLSA